MDFITLILILIVIGFVTFLFRRFVPMSIKIKDLICYVIYFAMAMMVIFYFLDLFGLYNNPIQLR